MGLPASLPSIKAHTDSGSFLTTQTGVIHVLANDLFSGSVATPTVVNTTLSGANPLTGSYIDTTTHNYIIPTGSATGSYTLQYTICDKNNANNCSTADIYITITGTPSPGLIPIDAVDDTLSLLSTQTGVVNLLENDTFSGAIAQLSHVTLTLTGANPLTGSYIPVESPHYTVPVGSEA